MDKLHSQILKLWQYSIYVAQEYYQISRKMALRILKQISNP